MRLSDVFKSPEELLRLEPEELAGVLIEIIPSLTQRGLFVWQNITEQVFEPTGGGWPRSTFNAVAVAVAEALNWLKVQGLVIDDPESSNAWLRLSRRGESLKSRADLEAYSKAGSLPISLLQPQLAEKVHHLFVRGDHDVAVFQAFKTVEVRVRSVCGYPDDLVGVTLMQKAFAVDDGPLRNTEAVSAERLSDMFLFAGAIGHAKNPGSHREVEMSREEAARLIIFASYLLDVIDQRIPGAA